MATMIEVENLGKRYRLGGQDKYYKTLRESLIRGILRPFQKLRGIAPQEEEFWALRNVSFTVEEGEVVGIIGRNGAGKSTLLKLLGRITRPTEGRAKLYGRVGSLLEVGTGFHPELTGRENIYLSGTLLGMTRAEVKKKFDEIVAFAEIEKFLDTPVKHYSSGMYVRLGFAIAAHLEPEILLVDEVLAVGDLQFQKKCLGKVNDVARAGRTVLFVSHSLGVIQLICRWCLLLDKGQMISLGEPKDVIQNYVKRTGSNRGEKLLERSPQQSEHFQFLAVRLFNLSHQPTDQHLLSDGVILEIEYVISQPLIGAYVAFQLWNSMGLCVLTSTDQDEHYDRFFVRSPGRYITRCHIPPSALRPGTYLVTLAANIPNRCVLSFVPHAVMFEVLPDSLDLDSRIGDRREGIIAPLLSWITQRCEEGGYESTTLHCE